jgi:hypothetical protein
MEHGCVAPSAGCADASKPSLRARFRSRRLGRARRTLPVPLHFQHDGPTAAALLVASTYPGASSSSERSSGRKVILMTQGERPSEKASIHQNNLGGFCDLFIFDFKSNRIVSEI